MRDKKKCKKCSKELPLIDFCKSGHRKDGSIMYSTICKKCFSEIRRTPLNPEDIIPAGYKKCTCCKKVKTLLSFNKTSLTKTGIQLYNSHCIECNTSNHKTSKNHNPHKPHSINQSRRRNITYKSESELLPETKYCKHCNQTKSLSLFAKNGYTKDNQPRYLSYCLECYNKHLKDTTGRPKVKVNDGERLCKKC